MTDAPKIDNTTRLARALAPLPMPKKNEVFIDSSFGTRLVRLTDDSDAANAMTAYSYWSALNCDSSQMILMLDNVPYLYRFDAGSMQATKTGPLFDETQMIAEGLTWSFDDPNLIYGISGYHANAVLQAYNTSSKSYVYERDFTKKRELPVGNVWQMSKSRSSDRYFSFHWRPSETEPVRYAVVFDKKTDKTYLFDVQDSYGFPDFDECRLDRNGRFLVMATGREMYIWEFAKRQAFERQVIAFNASERAGGHYDLGSNLMIQMDLWGQNGCRAIVRSLDGGTYADAFDSGAFKDWTTDAHFSLCGPSDEWALLSTRTSPSDFTKPFSNEIFLVGANPAGGVLRLAHHRSSNLRYEAQPKANLSPDGRFAVFNSDWGSGGRIDAYALEIPADAWKPALPVVVAPDEPKPLPPVEEQPVAAVAAEPIEGFAPLKVKFSSKGSKSPSGRIADIAWDFGDDSPGKKNSAPVHVYKAAGTFTAILRITDAAGKTAEAAIVINVKLRRKRDRPEMGADL